jgi:DNA polymerase-3 subunit beta
MAAWPGLSADDVSRDQKRTHMKVICPRLALAGAFATVSGVVPPRSPKPILSQVKFQAVPGEAILIGTDSEIGIRYELESAEVLQPGEVLLPCARVSAILRELQGERVTIEATDEATVIRGERAEYRLPTSDPAEFPVVQGFDAVDYHILSSESLKKLIRRTVFATDTESTRYALGGVLCELKGDGLTLAATDTRRLAVVHGVCTAHGAGAPASVIPVIPSKAMSQIEKNLGAGDEQAWVAIRTNDVLVRTGPVTISSRLVEGRFPKYQDVIPAETPISFPLIAGAFYSAVRQAQIVTSDESRGVDFVISSGMMTLKSSVAEVGQSTVELPIAYEGEELTITFDPRYVADFLKVLDPAQTITLGLQDSESAAVFTTDDGYTYVVMPLSKDS